MGHPQEATSTFTKCFSRLITLLSHYAIPIINLFKVKNECQLFFKNTSLLVLVEKNKTSINDLYAGADQLNRAK